jgi:hypothetical protein
VISVVRTVSGGTMSPKACLSRADESLRRLAKLPRYAQENIPSKLPAVNEAILGSFRPRGPIQAGSDGLFWKVLRSGLSQEWLVEGVACHCSLTETISA